ncbi:unnamed protein product [Heterobilharzia americana]|nr:unnamed protein product [Heterobilharzia americana]
MIEKAGIKSTDSILEIGSGTGNLTIKLLEKARKVYAFEIDPRMVSELQKRVQTSSNRSKLEILVGDAVKATSWPKFDLCVANLPYKISSPFIQRLINAGRGFRAAVVMLQKEFADRLIAKLEIKCTIEQLMKISRNSFRPPPRVDSAVVRIEPRHPLPPVMSSEWDGLLRLVFARKNKTIGANFAGKSIASHLRKIYIESCSANGLSPTPQSIVNEPTGVSTMEEKLSKILQDSGFEKKRARTLDEDDLLRLLLVFKKENIFFG